MIKVLLALIALVIPLSVAFITFNYYKPDTEVLTINDTVRECKGMMNGDCRYVVYTDKGVYENKDTAVYFKFNSSDLHNTLLGLKGKQATLRSYGFRIPLFSSYKNIIEVVE